MTSNSLNVARNTGLTACVGRVLWLAVCLVALFFWPALAGAQLQTLTPEESGQMELLQSGKQGKVLFERWYVVNLGEDRTGWLHAQEMSDGENLIDQMHMLLVIRRGEIALRIETMGTFTETVDGKLVEAVSVQKISKMATTTRLTFEPGKVTIVTEQGKQRNERSVMASSQPWMTPAALSRYLRDELAKGSQEIKAWSIEPSLGPDPFETTLTITGQKNVQVMGKVVPATVMTSTTSRMPGVTSTLYADAQGRPVRMNMDMGGIKLHVVESDKAVALAPIDPPQLLAEMLIKPKSTIRNPRDLKQAVYELKILDRPAAAMLPQAVQGKEGKPVKPGAASPLKLPDTFLPAGAYQRVVWSDDQTVRVVVDLNHPVAPGTDLPTADDLNASPMLDSSDPKIKELAVTALRNVPANASQAAKAEALRRFVYQYIDKKDLSVGFASAGEVARTGQGDCTEHAVLLAALLREQGIASRTVSGLVYVDEFEGHEGIFGYHMWTRAWLKTGQGSGEGQAAAGHWADLDATLDPDKAFDATHIALGSSSMSQGIMANDMLVLAPVMGRLTIEPIGVPAGGSTGKR